MLILQDISYIHPNNELLFEHINFTVNKNNKIALIGNNGSGKSTILKIIANQIEPTSGRVILDANPYYIPQLFGQFNNKTIAQALHVEDKIHALHEILNGNVTEENFELLQEDWTIEDRCEEALKQWHLSNLDLNQKMGTLSGGQKTKVFLAGILIHQPELILMDEPSNHLDTASRQQLYNLIQNTNSTILVVSHDRALLNLLNSIAELRMDDIQIYGGNYTFYKEQKQIEKNALEHNIQNKEKALRKAKEKERETLERKQKADIRAKKNLDNAGLPKILANTRKNKAENTSAKLKDTHIEKIGGISQKLQELRSALPAVDKIKFGLDSSNLHPGKIIFSLQNINFRYSTENLWKTDLNFKITSGERIAFKGQNGSGKTTLIQLIIGQLQPTKGNIHRKKSSIIYIDQDYSLIDNTLSVYEQAQRFNSSALLEHDIKIRLNRFLFGPEDWDKVCINLSGGEKMRLMLCCLTMANHAPDIIILDEPTNNLDILNIDILTSAIKEYNGTLLIISHDEVFLQEIGITRVINLNKRKI